MMLFKHIVLIAIGIANVSALDNVLLNDEVTSIVEEVPHTNLRGVVTDTTATVDDSDMDIGETTNELEEEEEEDGDVSWLAAAHRMMMMKKKLTPAQKKAKQALKKLENNKKNKNNGNNKNNNNSGGGSSTRAECTDRGNKKWCLNEWQPLDGTCKWANKKCSKQRADCVDRGNVNWCTNEVSALRELIMFCMYMICSYLTQDTHLIDL